ncbi:hypothetical protein D3C80_1710770 [compost metagenome]
MASSRCEASSTPPPSGSNGLGSDSRRQVRISRPDRPAEGATRPSSSVSRSAPSGIPGTSSLAQIARRSSSPGNSKWMCWEMRLTNALS